MRLSLIAAFIAGLCIAQSCNAVVLIAQKSDTFISESSPDKDFGDADYIGVSCKKGDRAMAYLTFIGDAADIGFVPESDKVVLATLSLRVKKVFPFVFGRDRNENPMSKKEEKEENKKIKEEERQEDESGGGNISSSIAEAADSIAEDIENASESKVLLEFYGITDDDPFEQNTKKSRVSWDGSNTAPAPKHNSKDDVPEDVGILKLGELEINIDKLEEDDLVEFTSPELDAYLNFAYGAAHARGDDSKFRSHLTRLERPTIIIRQASGKSGIFFYSANSMGEEIDKTQSGDEVPEKENTEKSDGTKSPESKLAQVSESAKASLSPAKIAKAAIPQNLGDGILLDGEEAEDKGNEKPDYRPRITFEFVNSPLNGGAQGL